MSTRQGSRKGIAYALQGVEVCHGGVVNLLHYYRTATAPLAPGSMFFQTMPFIFDGSIMDIWLPLSMGCGVVVAPADDIKDPDIARQLIKQHSVVFLMITPSQFQVRYVLVKATPTPPKDELPLDFGNGEPAIRSLSFSGWPGAQLQGGTTKPNTIICYGWSCMDSLPR